MKKNLIIGIVFLILLSFNVSAEVNEDILTSLNDFYTASSNGDVDKYLEVQDPLFLEIMANESGINLKDYYQELFNEVKTSNIELDNVKIVVTNDSALVFYRLSGDYESADYSGKIDNDMVAFLWKYDEWKVRWTITRSLYEEKIGMTYAMDAVIEDSVNQMINKSVKDELIEEGINVSIENYEFKEPNKSNWLIYVLIIGVIIFIIIKFKDHKSIKSAKDKVYNSYSNSKPKLKKFLDKSKEKSIKIHNDAKPKIKHIVNRVHKKSVKVYEHLNAKSKKVYKNNSPKIKKLHEDIKSKLNKKKVNKSQKEK